MTFYLMNGILYAFPNLLVFSLFVVHMGRMGIYFDELRAE